jgi:hypothetical protein
MLVNIPPFKEDMARGEVVEEKKIIYSVVLFRVCTGREHI